MSYTINLTNGSTLTSVVDGQINQTATDLTLIGKNYTGFGEYINENFIKILEICLMEQNSTQHHKQSLTTNKKLEKY